MIEELTVQEIIDATYYKAIEHHKPEIIIFPPVSSKIIDCPGHNLPVIDYMQYSSVALYTFNEKHFVVGLGKTKESKTKKSYNNDIIAFPITNGKPKEKLIKDITKHISEGRFFANSLIHSYAGNFAFNKSNKYSSQLLEKINFERFMTLEEEVDEEIKVFNLTPVYLKHIKYQAGLIYTLERTIIDILRRE